MTEISRQTAKEYLSLAKAFIEKAEKDLQDQEDQKAADPEPPAVGSAPTVTQKRPDVFQVMKALGIVTEADLQKDPIFIKTVTEKTGEMNTEDVLSLMQRIRQRLDQGGVGNRKGYVLNALTKETKKAGQDMYAQAMYDRQPASQHFKSRRRRSGGSQYSF